MIFPFILLFTSSTTIIDAFCFPSHTTIAHKIIVSSNNNGIIIDNKQQQKQYSPSSLYMTLSEGEETAAAAVSDRIINESENEILNILGTGRIKLSKDEEEKLNLELSRLFEQQQQQEFLSSDTNNIESLLIGNWKLLYTTKSKFDIKNPLGKREDGTTPGLENIFPIFFSSKGASSSSSPIQRLVTNLESIDIYQNIIASGRNKIERVDQLVKNKKSNNNDNILLRLSASGNYDNQKKRINFSFDLAYFNVLGVRVPYPVPFRLLGDEAKGYLDTKIITSKLRVSTGNKGTSFILRRDV